MRSQLGIKLRTSCIKGCALTLTNSADLSSVIPLVASKHVHVMKKSVVILGENKTCFSTKLLKFGVELDEHSRAK